MIEDRHMKSMHCKPATLEAAKDNKVVKPGAKKKRKPTPLQEPPTVRLTGTFISLEPRILFDGAALATGAEVVQDTITQDQPGIPGTEGEASTDSTHTGSSDQDALWVSGLSHSVPPDRKKVEGINPTAEVIQLDSTRGGIEQIAEALTGRTDIEAIHLIWHGNQAELQLGPGHLTFDSIPGEYVDEVRIITAALADTPNILIDGCNFGKEEAGRVLSRKFLQFTGVEIACTVLPGIGNFVANWDLELKVGLLETQGIITRAGFQKWQRLLTETTYIAYEPASSDMGDQAHEIHSTKPWGQPFSYDSPGWIYRADRIGLVLSSTFPSGSS